MAAWRTIERYALVVMGALDMYLRVSKVGGPVAGLAGGVIGGLRARRRQARSDAGDIRDPQVVLERERLRQAEEALRLERLRQDAAREIGEVRVMSWIAVGVWFASALLLAIAAGRLVALRAIIALASGWTMLLVALVCALAAYSAITRAYEARARDANADVVSTEGLVTAARWLLAAGLALTGAGLLMRLG
jgi:hypothetical protein